MKKFKTILVFALGILATAIFGACSCTKDSTISVTSLTLSTQVANNTTEDGKLIIDVILDDEFEISYNLAPKATTNTKVFVDIVTPGGDAYLTPEAYIFDNGTSYSVKFTAKSKNTSTDDPTPVEVKFTSESAYHTASAIVNIHNHPTPLDTPQNLRYSDGQLVWNAVEHADKYIVAINGKDYITPSTIFTPVLNTAVENVINITAVSDDIKYANSQESDNIKIFPLATPTITSSDNGVLTWDAVEKATKYILDINGTLYDLSSDILTYDIKSLVSTSFNIKLKAVFEHKLSSWVDGFTPYTDDDGCLYYTPTSSYTSEKTINRLSAPTNLKITNKDGSMQTDGILSWDSVQGASSYTIVGTNGADFEFTTSDTYLDFANMADFNYSQGNYSLTVKANGQPSNTITDVNSVSNAFQFVKMGYLSGGVDAVENTLAVDVSSLYTMLDSEIVGKIKYEITFVCDNQTSLARNKNITLVSTSAIVPLSTNKITAGEYRKIVIRPYVDDLSVINVANATKINIIDQIPTYASGFVKLPNSNIGSISKESVLKVDVDAENIESFEITLDGEYTQNIAKDANCVSIEDTVNIDLTELYLGFGQISLSAGAHTIKIRGLSSKHIDADENSAVEFGFTKLNAVSDITVVSNKLSWTEIQNHSGYQLEFNSTKDVVFENTYSPSVIYDTNIAKVTALGNDVNVINSDTVTNSQLLRADKVDTISFTDGTISWENQSGVISIIKFYSNGGQYQTQQTTTSNTFDAFNLNRQSSLSITRRVNGKFDSLESDKIQVEQRRVVPVESIAIVDNDYKLKYENDESSSVLVKIVNASGSINTQKYLANEQSFNNGIATINLNSSYLGVGLNYITIVKLGDTTESASASQTYKVRSVESERVEVEVLPALTHKIENGVLSTSIASTYNPKSMTVEIKNLKFKQTINIESKTAEFDLSNIDSGTYSVVASAQANVNTNVINGSETMFEISKISGTKLKVVDGKVVFDKVANATGYVVKMYNSQGEFVQNITTNTQGEQGLVNINTASLTAGINYGLSISVLADVELNSKESDQRTIQKLPTVQNFVKQKGKLSWDGVTNNSGYILSGQNGFLYTVTTNVDATHVLLPNTQFETAGKYTVDILARGNSTTSDSDTGYLNGDSASLDIYKLNDPDNIALENGILSWNAYSAIGQEHIQDTVVIITVGETPYTYNCGNSTSLDLNELTELAGNGFTITIQFKGNGDDIIDSDVVDYNNKTVVSRLSNPVLSVSGGELCFDKVENAYRYEIYLKQTEKLYTLIESQNYTLLDKDTYFVVKFKNTALVANNMLDIACKSIIGVEDDDTKLNSFYSDTVKISKLRIGDAGLRIDEYNGIDGRLVWDKVENATNYTIYIQGQSTQQILVEGGSTEYFDITGLNLVVGEYTITLRANGTDTTSTSINYLNSDISNSVTITLKNDAINIRVENDILKWDRVDGVDSYKVTITNNGQSQITYVRESGNNSLDLKNNEFLSAGGQTYTISVVPFKLDSSYYLVETSSPVYLKVEKSKILYDLKVEDGLITWKVDTTAIASNLGELKAYFERYRDEEDATEIDLEGKKKYQTYYPYFNFQLVLNGISSNIIPDTMILSEDNSYVKYYYLITTQVEQNTRFEINIKTCGNSNVFNENQELVSDVVATVSSNLLSKSLVAYKTTVPSGVSTHDGLITFNLVTTGDSQYPYIQQYLIYAVPKVQGLVTLSTTITIVDAYFHTSPAPSTYTFNVKEWIGGETSFHENIEYSYMICTYGSQSGDVNSEETLYLRSNFYSTVGMTFLSSIDVTFSKDWKVSDESIGAVVSWSILSTKESMTHILYILPENTAQTLGDDWWKDSRTITITLDSQTNYFDFASDLAKENGIQSNMSYRVAAKYGGDERSFITNSKSPTYINVETLPETTFNGVQVKDGVFEWQSNANANQYKVTLYKKVGENISKSVHYTTSNTFSVETSTISDAQYAISVLPFGNVINYKNYVNGFANDITSYYSLMETAEGLEVSVINGQNTLCWTAVDGATDYIVSIDQTENNSTSTSYTLPNFSAGEHIIKVKARANSGYLNGVYSDAVYIVKLYNPNLKVSDGIVSWLRGDNSDDVLASAYTVLNIKECDENGDIVAGGKSERIELTQSDGFEYALDSNYDNGYYKIAIKYEVALVSTGRVAKYQLSSDESTMLTYKLDKVSGFENGKYIEPEDTTTIHECQFDNYIKWKKVDNAYGYLVRLINDEGQLIDSNTKQIKYLDGKMTGDISYFEDCKTDDNYICFNLKQMSDKRVSSANVEVTVLGNSTTSNTIIGYLNSDAVKFKVELPQGAPKIISIVNGVIKWIGAYDFSDEAEIEYTYSESAVASSVEIEFSNAIEYTYNAETNSRIQKSQTISSRHVWQYAEGKEQVFYCPYASSSNIYVKIRYYNTNYVSPWSPVLTISANELFVAGTGTEDDPYIIAKLSDETDSTYQKRVQNIKYRPNSYFAIKHDVSLQGITWKTIDSFGGVINGENHSISGITLNDKNPSMFGTILSGAKISNLNISNVSITTTGCESVGAIANTNNGTISNITISGSVNSALNNGNDFRFGGVVVTNNGIIEKSKICYNGQTASTTGVYISTLGNAYVGGVVVENNNTIDDCTVDSIITVSIGNIEYSRDGCLGGIAYSNTKNGSVVSNCQVSETSVLTATSIGGVVYQNKNYAQVSHCSMQAKCVLNTIIGVAGGTQKIINGHFGGLVGKNNGYVKDSYVDVSDIQFNIGSTSSVYVGLLIGFANTYDQTIKTGEVSNCYVSADSTVSLPSETSANYYIGYIVGSMSSQNETFENIYVQDPDKLSNLVGKNESLTVTQKDFDTWKSENNFN